jgi:ElaB/YqjD/DUF883 family membrane-anchored ribosome-binding protein
MAENGGSGMGAEARGAAREAAEQLQDRLEGMRGYAEDAGEWIREMARERPVVTLAVAVGVGFVFGRLLSRT